jgi:hypothetical protein
MIIMLVGYFKVMQFQKIEFSIIEERKYIKTWAFCH